MKIDFTDKKMERFSNLEFGDCLISKDKTCVYMKVNTFYCTRDGEPHNVIDLSNGKQYYISGDSYVDYLPDAVVMPYGK